MKHSKKNFSKPVLFLAASLIACQPVSALGVTFSDLDKVPWPGAETSIQKAAACEGRTSILGCSAFETLWSALGMVSTWTLHQ